MRALQAVATLPIPAARAILADGSRARAAAKPRRYCSICARPKGKTEVDVLNGAVARYGLELGVATPVNATIARVLSDIAAMPQLWAKYREQPDALEEEVRDEIKRAAPPARPRTLAPV